MNTQTQTCHQTTNTSSLSSSSSYLNHKHIIIIKISSITIRNKVQNITNTQIQTYRHYQIIISYQNIMNTQTQTCHQRTKTLSITNSVQNIMNTQTHHHHYQSQT